MANWKVSRTAGKTQVSDPRGLALLRRVTQLNCVIINVTTGRGNTRVLQKVHGKRK